MKAVLENIDAIDKLKNICKRHCEIIETCLIDYEKYSISDLLANVANSINQIRISTKAAEINNAIKLASAMQSVITHAIEGKIDLFTKDIDILLRSNDLFFGIQQFQSDEIKDLFEFEEDIIFEFINEIKTIIAPYRLKNKTENKKSFQNILKSEEKENKAILLEKFKFALVKSTHTIEQTLSKSSDEEEQIDVFPVSDALNTIKGAAISAGISKAFDLADSMQEFLAYSVENNMAISSYQMDMLVKCNRLFKEIAAGSAVALIDKFNDYTDYIDSYSSFLHDFLSDKEVTKRTASSKIISDDIIFDNFDNSNGKSSNEKPIYFGYKSTVSSDLSKYNRMLESTIEVISNLFPIKNSVSEIKDLKYSLRQIQLENNNILYNITNTERITEIVLGISEKLDEIVAKIDSSTMFIENTTDNIKSKVDVVYNNLFQLRSSAFGDMVLGFNDLAADLAKYSAKKVKMKIVGRFVRVGSEVTPLLGIVLPQLLRYLIVNNIELPEERISKAKQEISEISITARLVSGRLSIEFEDDGYGRDSLDQSNDLENIINMINNNKGRIEIKSQSDMGTKITVTFDLDYILLKSLLFELGGNLYGLQIIDAEQIINTDELDDESKPDMKIIDMRKVLHIKGEYISKNKPAALIRSFSGDFALIFDKFICEAELVPTKPNGLFSKNPFVNATAVYNDAPVIILDKNKLLNILID